MSVVLPPSTSRIYIHGVVYKNDSFINETTADKLVQLILQIQRTKLKELQFQSIKIINIHHLNTIGAEIHIGNVIYYMQRILTMDLIDKLRHTLSIELMKNTDLKFEQINILNDEYIVDPTVGYYDGV